MCRFVIRLSWPVLLVMTACIPLNDSGGTDDDGNRDTDSVFGMPNVEDTSHWAVPVDTDLFAPRMAECPAPALNECQDMPGDWAFPPDHPVVLLAAEELEAGATFLAIHAYGDILMRSSDRAMLVVLAFSPDTPHVRHPTVTVAESTVAFLPVNPDAEVRAVANRNTRSWTKAPDWLICVDEHCTLYHQPPSGGPMELIPAQNGTVPCEPEVQGIMGFDDLYSHEVCVFGRGICCHNGEDWTVRIAPGPEMPLLRTAAIRTASMEYRESVLAGDQGRVVFYSADDILDNGSAEHPDYQGIHIDNYPLREWFWASDGNVHIQTGPFFQTCPIWNETIRTMDTLSALCAGGRLFFGVTGSGRFFRSQSLSESLDFCMTEHRMEDILQTQVIGADIYCSTVILTQHELIHVAQVWCSMCFE